MDSKLVENEKLKIKFKYDFGKNYPTIIKMDSHGWIYLGDGEAIFKFDKTGNLNKKIIVSKEVLSQSKFIDFTVTDEGVVGNKFYLNIDNKIIGIDSNSNVIFNSEGGVLLRLNKDNFYTDFQSYDKVNDVTLNRIRVLNKIGGNYFYPIKADLGGSNFEIIDDNIMLFSSENILYILPTDTTKVVIRKKINIPEDDRTWFLGKTDGLYAFRKNNFKEKVDIIYIFDNAFNLIKTSKVNVSYAEIAEGFRNNDDYLLDFPSGNIYYYSSNENIYYLRNTDKGTFLYDLSISL